MIELIILDSSVLVAYFNTKDELHEKSLEFLEKTKKEQDKVVVPAQVIFEISAVLKRLGAAQVETAKFCEELTKSSEVQPTTVQALDKALALFKTNKKLSLTDSFLVVLSGELNARIATFDQELLKAAGR